MELFGANASPFVRKVLLYAAEKGLELTLKPGGIGASNPDFEAISPFRKIPAFRDGDFSICDSTAIITYLEAKYPVPSLIPADPAARAWTIWFEELADTILAAAGSKIFFNRVVAGLIGREGDMAVADGAEKDELPRIYAYLEGVVPDSGFLVEDRLTLADIAVVSPIVNMGYCSKALAEGPYPKLQAYVAAILARPALKAVIDTEMKVMGRA